MDEFDSPSSNSTACASGVLSSLSLRDAGQYDDRPNSAAVPPKSPESAGTEATSSVNQQQFQAPQPPKQRSKHWDTIRHALIPEKKINIFQIFGSKVNAPIPYTISIYQGIQFKFDLHPPKRLVVCGFVHPRMFTGGTQGGASRKKSAGFVSRGIPGRSAVGSKGRREDYDSDSGSEDGEFNDSLEDLVNEINGVKKHAHTTVSSQSDSNKSPGNARVALTAVYIDNKNFVTANDITKGAAPFRTLVHNCAAVDVSQFVPVISLGLYVGCSHDETLKIFNTRFEHVTNVLAWQPVIRVQWVEALSRLAAFGTNTVTFWSIDSRVDRGEVRATATLEGTIEISGIDESTWITYLLYEPRHKRIYLVVGAEIHVYTLNLEIVCRITPPSSRQIMCLEYHADLQYLFAGVNDGSIQVWNLSNTLIHEFTGHLKAVSALKLYNNSLLISASRDGSVRLWNVATFRMSYRMEVKEELDNLGLVDKHQIWVTSSKGLSVWGINMINQTFSHVNSDIVYMRLFKTSKVPARLLIGSDDGVWRLLSPVNGKVLTTCIPMSQHGKIHDASYSARTHRMFFLLDSGDIWIAATDSNPSVMIEHWKLGSAAKEDCCCICAFDGNTPERKFTFLIGGTRNGQVILYTQAGTVGKRFQVHAAQVVNILSEQSNSLISSLSVDNVIRICQIDVKTKEILIPKVSFQFSARPTTFCTCDQQLLVGTDDGVVSRYNFNIRTGDHRQVPAHPRHDDHSDAVISTSFRKRWGLFVTLGQDSALKVWDIGNVLLREVQFDEQPTYICICNSWGDLLVSWENRIDIIRYTDYLPPGYIQSISSAFHKSTPAEVALPLEPNQELMRLMPRKALPARPSHALEYLDLIPDNSWRPTSESGSLLPDKSDGQIDGDETSFIASSTQMVAGSSDASIIRQPTGLKRKIIPRVLRRDDSIVDVPPFILAEADITVEELPTMPVDSAISLEIPEVRNDVSPKKSVVRIPNDGIVPNSKIEGLRAPIVESQVVKMKKREVQISSASQQRRSDEYKSRLNRLLAMIPKRVPVAETPAPPAASNSDLQAQPQKRTRPKPERGSLAKRRIPPPSSAIVPEPVEEAMESQDDLVTDMPKLIRKALEFNFFQEKQLFSTKEGREGRTHKTLAVDPTPDGLLPLLLSTFETCDLLLKKEMAEFINWMNEEYEFTHARRILDMYLEFLFKVFMDPVNDLEKDLIVAMLGALNQFGTGDPDVMTCLLLYTIYGDVEVEEIARKRLADLGVEDPSYHLLAKRIESLFFMAKRGVETKAQIIATARKYVLAWIRRIPRFLGAVVIEESEVEKKTKKKRRKKRKAKKNIASSGSMENLIRDITSAGQEKDGEAEEQDSIIALMNQWVTHQKDYEAMVEAQRQEQERLRKEKEAADAIIAERLARERAEFEAREAARREREERRRREWERARARMNAPRPPKYPNPQHGPCHPSRESLFFKFQLPPLQMDADNMISAHLVRLNKSLPIELINPRPFSRSTRISIHDPEFRTFTSASPTGPSRNAGPPTRRGSIGSTSSTSSVNLLGKSEEAGFATRKKFMLFQHNIPEASEPKANHAKCSHAKE